MTSSSATLSLHAAGSADRGALTRLAALDSAAELREPVLLAAVDGRPVAAMSLADGRVVADPFSRSAEAVELLRVRAGRERSVAPVHRRRLGRVLRPAVN
jgi:hypothetical protein